MIFLQKKIKSSVQLFICFVAWRAFVALILTSPEFVFCQYVVKGTIAGSTDISVPRMDVFLVSNDDIFPRDVIKRYSVNPDGSFRVSFSKPGLYRLRFTGVNYRKIEVPFYFEEADTITTQIELPGIKTIRFDAKKLPAAPNEAKVRIISGSRKAKIFFDAWSYSDEVLNRYYSFAKTKRLAKSDSSKTHYMQQEFEWAKYLRHCEEMIAGSTNLFSRSVWVMSLTRFRINQLLNTSSPVLIEKEMARDFLNQVKPNSPLWSLSPNSLTVILSSATFEQNTSIDGTKNQVFLNAQGESIVNYARQAFETHPDSSIKQRLMRIVMGKAYKFKRFQMFERYYDSFMNLYQGTMQASTENMYYRDYWQGKSQSKTLRNYGIHWVEEPAQELQFREMKGTNYILNYLEIDCSVCETILKELAVVYKKHHQNGLEIINVFMPRPAEEIRAYLKRQKHVTWKSAVIRPYENSVFTDHTMLQYPKLTLLDEDGEEIFSVISDRKKIYARLDMSTKK